MGLFDGMAGLLNGVFGGSVIHIPAVGAAVTIQGIFRREPIQVADDYGREILVEMPSLRVLKPVAATIATGDVIQPGDGRDYRVLSSHDSGSPGADAFVVFALEDG